MSAGMIDHLERARAGDAEAYGEICRIHETRLLRQALALCGNQTLAVDLAQDTLVEGWRCLHRFNGRCRFFTWLCAILLNRYRNTLRNRRDAIFTTAVPETDNAPEVIHDPAPSPDQVFAAREHATLVWQCIRSLPARHREVVVLRFYIDDSLAGIAAALGCSVGTVKSRLFHALEKLRAMPQLRDRLVNSPTRKALP